MHFKEKRLDWGKIWRRKAEKTRWVAKNCLCFVVKPNTKVEDRERQAQMVLRYFIDASETLFDPLVVVPGVASVILTLCWGGRLPLAPP